MTTPAKFPPDGFAVIAAAPKWLPSTCTYVRGFVVDPRRDGIGILVLESDDASIAIGEVRHLAFAPHLCELDSLASLIAEDVGPEDAEGNSTKIVKTAEIALSFVPPTTDSKTGLGNWNVAMRVDGELVRMEEALQAVLAAREAAKAPEPVKPAEIAGPAVVVQNVVATP